MSSPTLSRCWPATDPLYVAYHDEEWGRPVTDERGIYERLCLEGFQSGLSWLTILRKRENFRRAFAEFDPDAVARFGTRDVATHERDINSRFSSTLPSFAHSALGSVYACRLPAVLREINREKAHSAAEINGSARRQRLGTLN